MLIAEKESYLDLLKRLKGCSQIAIDTEADSLYSYYDKLCLIQLAFRYESEEQFLLLDPLHEAIDIAPFLKALANQELIFHDADYDLRLLRRLGKLPEITVFDTMIAAKLCGEAQLGLAALVKKYFSITLSKASRKANWAQRPLSENMREYALNDVRYLRELAELLRARLEELGRLSWFQQSCQRMVDATKETRAKDPDKEWKISGWSRLSERGMLLLKELWSWREKVAQQQDRPPFIILRSHHLLMIADAASNKKPIPLPKLSSSLIRKMEVVLEKAMALPLEEFIDAEQKKKELRKIVSSGAVEKFSPEEKERFEKWKLHRNKLAASFKIDPTVIASKGMLEALVKDPQTEALLPWQREVLGL